MRRVSWLLAAVVLAALLAPGLAVGTGSAARLPVTAAPLQTWRVAVDLVLPEPEVAEQAGEAAPEPDPPVEDAAPEVVPPGTRPYPQPGGATPAPTEALHNRCSIIFAETGVSSSGMGGGNPLSSTPPTSSSSSCKRTRSNSAVIQSCRTCSVVGLT